MQHLSCPIVTLIRFACSLFCFWSLFYLRLDFSLCFRICIDFNIIRAQIQSDMYKTSSHVNKCSKWLVLSSKRRATWTVLKEISSAERELNFFFVILIVSLLLKTTVEYSVFSLSSQERKKMIVWSFFLSNYRLNLNSSMSLWLPGLPLITSHAVRCCVVVNQFGMLVVN